MKMDETEITLSAKCLLNPETKEHCYCAAGQITILGSYENILNERGIEFYQSVLKKVDQNDYKDTLVDAKFQMSKSGPWLNNKNHLYYQTHPPVNQLTALMNTWNNWTLTGFSEKHQQQFITSHIRFATKTWVFTESGSLYKIDPPMKGIPCMIIPRDD